MGRHRHRRGQPRGRRRAARRPAVAAARRRRRQPAVPQPARHRRPHARPTDAARLRERFGDGRARLHRHREPVPARRVRPRRAGRHGGPGAAAVGAGGPRRGRRAGRDRRTRPSGRCLGSRTAPGFDAAVEVCVPVIEVGGPRHDARWSAHLARRPRGARRRPAAPVGRWATRPPRRPRSAASTTAWSTTCTSRAIGPTGSPLVTTGLVDLGRCAWGERPARIGGRTWERPGPRRRRRSTGGPPTGRGAPAGRSWWSPRRPGSWRSSSTTRGAGSPGVPLVVVLAPTERLWPLAAALAAPAVSAWLLARAAGTALTPRALKVTAALLREVPLPADARCLGRGTGGVPGRRPRGLRRRRCPPPTARDRTWRPGGSSGRERSGVRRRARR